MKITEYLAIYAACLSTLVFIWNISKSIPKFKVDLMLGIKEDDGDYTRGLYLIVRNHSPHKIHIAGVDILYQYEESSIFKKLSHFFKYRNSPKTVGWVHCSPSLYGVDENFPVELEGFKSHDIFISDDALKEILSESINQKVRAKAQDQLWNNRFSKEIKYEVLD